MQSLVRIHHEAPFDFNRELNSQLLLQELLFYLFFKKNQSLPFILRAFHGRAEPRRLIDFGPTSYQDDSGIVQGRTSEGQND